MKPGAVLVNQLDYIYRSGGVRGLARLGLGKLVSWLVSYQRFVVLKAPLGPARDAADADAMVVGGESALAALRDTEWPEAGHVMRRYAERGPSGDLQLVVARSDDRLAGVCLYEFDVVGLPGLKLRAPVRSYFIHQIAVSPAFRGRGIMGRLLEHADALARAQGAQWRLCLVAPWNRPSLTGFRKSGAIPCGSVRVIRVFGMPFYAMPAWLRMGR